ncbi:MAG: glycoside hydrolase [Betaproteobacteria bacterium HGW-Betaproteobacteria-2]|jgi:cell wall-associated NlpC family hydrolase|nr:MAG: glycoside hydrolase [Betaproteobacteria bacterium HGW-Betaproteobacteria-2]
MRTFQLWFTVLLLLTASPAGAKGLFDTIQPSTRQPTTHETQYEIQPSWQSTVQEVLLNALSLKGVRYRYGGTSPETGFDCSGFVRYVFREAANISLPHNARAISQIGNIIAPDQLQPGDLVFYNTMKSAFSHVGIYLGNNRFIHAPSSGGGIRVVDMNDAYWSKRFDGARRITDID